jgi:hypothetical protein
MTHAGIVGPFQNELGRIPGLLIHLIDPIAQRSIARCSAHNIRSAWFQSKI